MRNFLTYIGVALLFAVASCSATNPVYAQVPGFQGLVARAVSSDKVLHGPDGEYHTLQKITPENTDVTHTANYFSVVGATTADGVFHQVYVAIVSEAWTKGADGNWTVDQWIYTASTDGVKVSFFGHNTVRETAEGIILPSKNPAPPTADEAMQKFLQIIAGF